MYVYAHGLHAFWTGLAILQHQKVLIGSMSCNLLPTFHPVSAAPCAVRNVVANLTCSNGTAKVSWSSANGANSYLVTAVATDGHQALCNTDGLQCDLTQLLCGQTYNVSLTAISDICPVKTQSNVSFSTRECQHEFTLRALE